MVYPPVRKISQRRVTKKQQLASIHFLKNPLQNLQVFRKNPYQHFTYHAQDSKAQILSWANGRKTSKIHSIERGLN